jgi:hypothetical protein
MNKIILFIKKDNGKSCWLKIVILSLTNKSAKSGVKPGVVQRFRLVLR